MRLQTHRRRVVLALAALVPVVVYLPANDAFNLPKAIMVVVGASIVLALLVREWVTQGGLSLPPKWASVALGAFIAGVLVATAVTGVAGDAVVGAARRYTGALLYLSVVVLAVSVATDFRPRDLGLLGRAVVVGGGLVAVYGLVQLLGLDPVTWPNDRANSTLGNTNFVSGYLAVVATLSVWLGLQREQPWVWRLAGAGAAAISTVVLLGTASAQGILALGGGLLVLAALWVTAVTEWTLRPVHLAAVVGAVVVVAGGMVVALGIDPLAALRGGAVQGGATTRVELGQTGLAMWRDNPIFGVGMDQFGSFVREYRPQSLAEQVSLQWTANEAHSVPVNMLATGGIVLALPYLAVMVVPFVLAGRGLRSGTADRRVLAGMAGGFSAYLLQSLVSVDVPALALTGWVLAGGVLVASGADTWRIGRPARSRRVPGAVRVGATVAGVVLVLVALIGGLQVLDADRLIKRSRMARNADVPQVAVAAAQSAVAQTGWWPEYWLVLAQAHEAAGNREQATAALEAGYERDPRNFAILLSMARFSAAHGTDPALWYERALAVDPTSAELAEEAAPHVEGAS